MKLLFPKQNYNVLSPRSYTHISVSDLYISRIDLPILLQGNMWTDSGNRSQIHECMNWDRGRTTGDMDESCLIPAHDELFLSNCLKHGAQVVSGSNAMIILMFRIRICLVCIFWASQILISGRARKQRKFMKIKI
jgi:hypothetical protein